MRRPGRAAYLLFLLFMISALSACRSTADGRQHQPDQQQSFPRYIFYFIGDGMGLAQVALGEALAGEQGGLAMLRMPVTGLMTTYALDRSITDSAAAGTAMATGYKTTVGTIARNDRHSADLTTIAEAARDHGFGVGIVSSVSIDHATPACFYAHADSRNEYGAIARQMAQSGFDYFGGGYALSALRDDTLDDELRRLMLQKGYTIAAGKEAIEAALPGSRCWAVGAVDSKGALAYEIDRNEEDADLAFFTRHGIRLLDHHRGFFLMVEGGKIDWACHANDGATVSREVKAFDRAIGEALAFYRSHPDETLIIVTADHECGGLALGNNQVRYSGRPSLLDYQQLSLERFSAKVRAWSGSGRVSFPMAMDSLRVYFGLGNIDLDPLLALSPPDSIDLAKAYQACMTSSEELNTYGRSDPFTSSAGALLNRKAGIGWTTGHHTSVPVPVFALGRGQERFGGSYDNTELAKKMMDLCGLSPVAKE